MCEPATILAITTAALSTGVALYGANQQKHALEAQATAQQQQIDQAASASTEDRMKAAREQRASARAAAAESGVSGNSADAILNDMMMQEGRDVSRIEKNRENGIAETSAEVRAKTGEINGQLIASLSDTAATTMKGFAKSKQPQPDPGH
jgi:hypothetical protein